MQATIDGQVFDVEIVRKKVKNITFRFKDQNTILITSPHLVPELEIKHAISKNEKSLARLYNKTMKHMDHQQIFTYLGKPTTKVFDETIKGTIVEDGFIYSKNEKTFAKWYKEECLRIFQNRIEYLLPGFTGIPPFSLKIRTMTSRWGVNNVTKKIITLNTELLKKDVSLIDYVIVHELCHFYEANHSPKFWAHVSKHYHYYKEARKELRD